MTLALALGKSKSFVLSLPISELIDWLALYQLRPFGEELSCMQTIFLGSCHGKLEEKLIAPFVIQKEKRQTDADMLRVARSIPGLKVIHKV